jgi:hypothetical protein
LTCRTCAIRNDRDKEWSAHIETIAAEQTKEAH